MDFLRARQYQFAFAEICFGDFICSLNILVGDRRGYV